MSGDHIRFGLVAVKGVGRGFINAVLAEREQAGAFSGFPDFCQRLFDADLNKRVLENLIKCGAFDSMGVYRSQLLDVCESVVDQIAQTRRKNLEGQFDLFGGGGDVTESAPAMHLKNLPEYSRSQLMRMEKETTGLYLTGHPMDEYRDLAKRFQAAPIGGVLSDFEQESGPSAYRDGQRLTLAGVVTASKTKTTRNNTLMAYVTLEDDTGSLEMLVFARVLAECGPYLKENMPILAEGRISVRDEKAPQLMCDRVRPLEQAGTAAPAASEESGKAKKLYIRVPSMDDPRWKKIQLILTMVPGEELFKAKFEAENQWTSPTPVVVHPALVRELEELLGAENVVVK